MFTEPFVDARALIRLQADHVNRTLVPAFYRYIQAQDEGMFYASRLSKTNHSCYIPTEKQVTGAKDFVDALIGLVMLFERAEAETTTDFGLWKKDGRLSLADVMAGPCQQCFNLFSVTIFDDRLSLYRDLPGNERPCALSGVRSPNR